jgi:uncharacterized protein (TIGR02145 family)
MTIWDNEIKDLDKLYGSFKGQIPDIVKELEQLIKTDDANVVMLYSRRCLEVIITDLCETELQRPRKTEPLKGIIDKLNSEEKVPGHIITSMLSLNSMATYGAHPKDFDPEQVKPVLNNLAIIIRWYLKFKDFQIVSKTDLKEEKIIEHKKQEFNEKDLEKSHKRKNPVIKTILIGIGILLAVGIVTMNIIKRIEISKKIKDLEARSGSVTDPRDGQVYRTIRIGDQVWMSENLRAEKLNDGTRLPDIAVDTAWWNSKSPAFSWYGNDSLSFKSVYGALYNWYAVNTGKLCPAGWHIPTDAEWTILTESLGGQQVAGDKLKAEGEVFWKNPYDKNMIATNESGFSAIPAGFRGCGEVQPSFDSMDYLASWWSSSVESENFIWRRYMLYKSSDLWRDEVSRQVGLSVRCLKN